MFTLVFCRIGYMNTQTVLIDIKCITALKFKKLVSCIDVEMLYRSGHYLEASVTSVTLYLENKNKYWIYYSCWMYWPRCCLFPTVCFPKLNDKNNKELNRVLSTKALGLTERLWHGQWKNPWSIFRLSTLIDNIHTSFQIWSKHVFDWWKFSESTMSHWGKTNGLRWSFISQLLIQSGII